MGTCYRVEIDEKCPECEAPLEGYQEKGILYTECTSEDCNFHDAGRY